jgi:hypothetical protein
MIDTDETTEQPDPGGEAAVPTVPASGPGDPDTGGHPAVVRTTVDNPAPDAEDYDAGVPPAPKITPPIPHIPGSGPADPNTGGHSAPALIHSDKVSPPTLTKTAGSN